MPAKRGRGRPPTTGTARNEILRVRVSEDERAQMQKAADAAGEPLAVWMYHKLISAARRGRGGRQ